MDANKVNTYMREFEGFLSAGNRLAPKQRELYEKIKAATHLDRPDVNVFVLGAHPANVDSYVWETYQGIEDFAVEGGGVLKVFIVGQDSDGDYVNNRVVVWPDGRWLKAESVLTRIPNPYYVDPSVEL